MADPEDTDVDDSAPDTTAEASATAYPAYTQPTTTREAQQYARKILDSYTRGDQTSGEAPIMAGLKANSEQAVKALQDARARLEQQTYDPRRTQLAWAAANLAPTRSGTIGESFGKGFDALHDELEKQQQFEMAKSTQEGSYDLAIPQQDKDYLKGQLDLQRLHEAQAGPLAGKAMTVLGREINKPASGAAAMGPMGNFGKTAINEGYQAGTPEYYGEVQRLVEIDRRQKDARAGVDAEDTPGQNGAAMEHYGVPQAPDPYVGFSTKERTAARAKDRTEGQKILDATDTQDQQNRSTSLQLDRFMAINKEHGTGGLQGNVAPLRWAEGLYGPNKEMDKISSTLGPLMRQPGMGRMTNLDLQTFMNSTVGRDKPYGVNRHIADVQQGLIQQQSDYNQFRRNYLTVHGHLNGADDAWQDYLDNNPYFDPKKPGSRVTNHVNFKDYFNGQRPKPVATTGGHFDDVTEADLQDPTFSGMTPAEIHAAKIPAHAEGGHIQHHADGGSQVPDYHADLADLARSLESGATGNFGDEINASVSPGSYASNIDAERGKMERFGNAHPLGDLGLQMTGTVGTGMALQKGAQLALEHLGNRGGKAAALAALTAKLIPKSVAGKASLSGATSGAVLGAGSAQGGDTTTEALGQGTIGALAGPFAGLASKYGVRGLQHLWDSANGNALTTGARRVLDAIKSDGMSTQDVVTKLQAAVRNRVPTTTVADVGGGATQGLTRAVATKPGDEVNAMVAGAADRNAGAGSRVADLINHHLAPDDYLTKSKELQDNLYSQAKPLYDAAYAAHPAVQSKVIGAILATPDGRLAGKAAFRSMQNKRLPIGNVDAAGMVRAPSLQYLDEVKRALDDRISVAERSGATSAGKDLRSMRNNLRDELDTATQGPNGQPGPYQQARAQYSGDMEMRDALQMGREDFSKMTPQELAAKVSGMSFAEKDALRTGAAEHLFQQVANTPYTANPAAKLANNAAIAQRLQALFDKPGDYKQFAAGLQQEMENFNRARAVVQSGATGQAQSGAEALASGSGDQAATAAIGLAGHPVWAGERAARYLANKLIRPQTAEQAATILNTPAGSARALFDGLRSKEELLGRRVASADSAGTLGAPAVMDMIQHNPQGYADPPDPQGPGGNAPMRRGGRMRFDDGGAVEGSAAQDLALMQQLHNLQADQASYKAAGDQQ